MSHKLLFPGSYSSMQKGALSINICTLCFLFQYSGITSGAEIWNRKPFEMQNNKLMYKQNAEKAKGDFERKFMKKHKQNSMKIKAALNFLTNCLHWEF